MNIQFFHEVNEKYTIALDVPTVEDLKNNLFSEIVIKTGIAYCNDSDQYIKSEGRRVATSKFENLTYKVVDFFKFEDFYYIILRNEFFDSILNVTLKSKGDKDSFYFITATMVD